MRRRNFNRLFPRLAGNDFARGPLTAADHLAALTGRPVAELCRGGEPLAEGILKARELYDSDFVVVFSDVYVEAEALGVALEFHPARNPVPLRHPEADSVRAVDITSARRVPQIMEAAHLCRRELGGDFPILYSLKDPFSLAALTVGPDRCLTLLLEDPGTARKLLETALECQSGLVSEVCRAGFIPLVGAPLASGSLLGPVWFERFVSPHLKPLLDCASAGDSLRCLHLCGTIGNLARQIEDLDLDLFSFEEYHPEIWKRMKRTVPLGFVPTGLFVDGDPDGVTAAVRCCLADLPRPAVLSAACDLPAAADPELVKVMMTAEK